MVHSGRNASCAVSDFAAKVRVRWCELIIIARTRARNTTNGVFVSLWRRRRAYLAVVASIGAVRSVTASEDAFAPVAAFCTGRECIICNQYIVLYLCCVWSFIVTTGLQIDKYAIRNARMVFQCSEAPNGILFCMNFTIVTPMNHYTRREHTGSIHCTRAYSIAICE